MEKEKLFKCELITPGGNIAERFYRSGYSPEDVKEGLAFFQWEDGEWEITDCGANPDDFV